MLRKTFKLTESEINGGTVYIWMSSLGYHELYVNGKRIGDKVLQPAVSQLNKRSLWLIYDITPYVNKGKNEVLFWVGQGWGRVYGIPAAVVAEVTWNDGKQLKILEETNRKWEASPSGYSYTGSWQPLQFGGERFDARVQPDWRPAAVYDAKGITISKQVFEGNRFVDTVSEYYISQFDWERDSTVLVSFNRVVTGWFQVEFEPMAPGTRVTLEYLDHYNAAPPHIEQDVYIARGDGRELFTNRFHTHAFEYVRIKGARIIGCQALQISAVDPKEGATFECSDPRLNAIHDMVKYTLSNLTLSGYMVDCPHLERMGYGGDGNSSTMTLQTLWDVRDVYANWMQAWGDAMEADGELPYVAPAFRTGGGPYWSGFIVKAPWRIYLNYGDKKLIVRYYDQMKRWLEFIERNSEDYILQPWPDNERHTWFLGDWLAPEGVDIKGESVLHVNSCFISDCLADMVQMARMRGLSNDAQHYAEWREQLNAAIHRHFYHPETHTYANGTPLDQAYALLMGIPPDSTTAAEVKAQLLKDCHGKYRDHIAVGLVGVPVFTQWCIRERETDLMATILRQEDYPGYLHMINQGATTTWESWDGHRSHVHNCYNGIGIWFYQALAGIRPDPKQPGYKHFFIDPQPCEGIDHIRATKPTSYGTIRVEIEKGKLEIEIPQGSTATLFPLSSREQYLESGKWIIDTN